MADGDIFAAGISGSSGVGPLAMGSSGSSPVATAIQWGNTPAKRQSDDVLREIGGLTHELNESLCAISNYLTSAELLLAKDNPDSRDKLLNALAGAAAQSRRAVQTARRQRALLL